MAATALRWDQSLYFPTKEQTPNLPLDDGEKNSNTEAVRQLETVGRIHPYPARASVFDHGDPAASLYLVRKGTLKLSLLSSRGRFVVFRFATAGDLLGLSAVLNRTDHEFLAQTLEPSTLVEIPGNHFLRLLQTSWRVNAFATQRLARDHKAMMCGIRRLGISASIRERLAQLLLNWLDSPLTVCPPMSIRINWTNGELADMVNSSRETVTRIMKQFEREQLIARHGSLVVIRNQAKLQLLASA